MAKYRHRIFEMFEFRAEAIRALTPRAARPVTDAADPESWTFKCLAVSLLDNVTLVGFKAHDLGEESETDLRADILQLVAQLVNDSKVLIDFAGVTSFSPGCIDTLALLDRQLRNKGSRMALCCVRETVRETFFAKPNGREKRG